MQRFAKSQVVGLLALVLALGASACDSDGGGGESQAVCGNGVLEIGEACEGADLGGESCLSLGFDGGELGCSDQCRFVTSACTTAETCGNGTLDEGEECDGANLAGATCENVGFGVGTLACGADCMFDTSGCSAEPCGNGVIDLGEDCDGDELGGASCGSEGFAGGALACAGDCSFDTSACTPDPCGNGVIDAGEDCDGGELGDATCEGRGFDGGTLACAADCTFDESACTTDPCGNGLIDAGEQCDGGNLNDRSCVLEGYPGGGVLACGADCQFVYTACYAQPCGNGLIDAGEQCDGGNLNSTSCDELPGFIGGQLACAADCTFDTGACTPEPPPCGNGVIDDGEDCDGDNLNGQTCADLEGFTDGALACATDCTFDTTGCLPETCVDDEYEENDDQASAFGPVPAGVYDLWLCAEDGVEEDWFYTELAAQDVLVVKLMFNGDWLDIDAFLYDESGLELDSSETAGDEEILIYQAGDAAETVYMAAIPYEAGFAPYTAEILINPPCLDDTGCDAGEICEDFLCVAGCRNDEGCGAGEICLDEQCLAGCRLDEECTVAGEICLDNQCAPGCRLDGDCAEGEVCLANACLVPECRENADCAFGEACVDYLCVTTSCLTDADCADYDLVCLVDSGLCVECNTVGDCIDSEDWLCEANACVLNCVEDAYEPNSTKDTAASVTAPLSELGLTLCGSADEDWFVLDLPALTRLEIAIAFSHALGDVDLYLYAPDSADFDNDFLVRGFSSTDDEAVAWDVAVAGLYYVKVEIFSASEYGQVYDLDITTTALGCIENSDCELGEACDATNTCVATSCTVDADCEDYDLVCNPAAGFCVGCVDDNDCESFHVCTDNVCVFTCTDDIYEPNDTMAEAVEIIPATYDLFLCDELGDEEDWFVFSLSEGDLFAANAHFDDSVVDVNLYLRDAEDGFLDSSTSSTADYEEVSYEAPADMDVYVRVMSNSTTERTGPYRFTAAINPTCVADDACDAGEICLDFACTAGCRTNFQCGAGELCFAFGCIMPECMGAQDCASGQVCVDYTCEDTACGEDADCADFGLLCDTTGGYCVECLALGDCPNGTDFSCEGGFCVLDCVEDAFEPNDAVGFAAPLVAPVDETGLTLCGQYEQDWYAMAYEAYMLYQIEVTLDSSEGDVDIYLYDETGALVASSLWGGDTESIAVVTGVAGTAYLRVQADQLGDYFQTYDLSVVGQPIDCLEDEDCEALEQCSDEYLCEPIQVGENCQVPLVIDSLPYYHLGVDFLSFGPDIQVEGSADECTGYSNAGPDVVYEITVQAGDVLYAVLDSDFDSAIYIINECVSPVPASACMGGADEGTGETLEWTAQAAGTYYLIVDYWASGTPWSGGVYDLTVVLNPTCIEDSECTVEGEICLDFVCAAGCRLDSECTVEGEICKDNQCAPGCRVDGDCEGIEVCDLNNVCVLPGCESNADCGLGGACVNFQCEATTCAADTDCDTYDMICDIGGGFCVECLLDEDCGINDVVCVDNYCVLDCVDDAFEPNDTQAEAAAIGAGEYMLALCEMTVEEDWFVVDLAAGETLAVYLVFSDDDADLELNLKNAAGTNLDSSTSSTDDEQCDYTATVDTTVYIRVYSSGTNSAPYDMIVAIDPPCLVDGDCGAGAICQQLECVAGCRTDANCALGEVCLEGECIVPACLTVADCAAGEACVDYACVTTACTALADCEDYDLVCDTVAGYCVECLDASDCQNADAFACVAGLCVLDCVEDAYEPNGEARAAAALTLPVAETGLTLCGQYDDDWFSLELEALTRYQFDLAFLDATGDIDVFLYAEGNTTTRLASATSSTDDESFAFLAPTAGTYLLNVRNLSFDSYAHSYDLAIAATSTVECVTAADCGEGEYCTAENLCALPAQGDSCLNPIAIDALPYSDAGRSISGFTNQVVTDDCTWRTTNGIDVVYALTVVEGVTYDIEVLPSFDAVLFVVNDCGLNAVDACFGYADDPEELTLTPGVGEGGTWYIVVEPYSTFTSTGTFTLTVSETL